MKIEERAALRTLANATVPAEPSADRRRNNAAASIVPLSVTNDNFQRRAPRSYRDHSVHVRHDRPGEKLAPSCCVSSSTGGTVSS